MVDRIRWIEVKNNKGYRNLPSFAIWANGVYINQAIHLPQLDNGQALVSPHFKYAMDFIPQPNRIMVQRLQFCKYQQG